MLRKVSFVDRQGESSRSAAIARAVAACDSLTTMGVKAKVIGSLAKGGFHDGSDIDFLITECPPRLKYRIEGIVEDCLGGMPFDVTYMDEIPPRRLDRVKREAVDARNLR